MKPLLWKHNSTKKGFQVNKKIKKNKIKDEYIIQTKSINLKEYSYLLLLEKIFFTKSETVDLEQFEYLIDYEIPMSIENYDLSVFLNSCGWLYDSLEDDNTTNNSLFIMLKERLLKLLKLKIKG